MYYMSVSLDQAKERMSSLVKLLEAAKSRYQELGGVLEEEVEQSKPKRGEDEGCVCLCYCTLSCDVEIWNHSQTERLLA